MRTLLAWLLAAAALGAPAAAWATTIDLPSPNPFNSATRGAFTVFSIPIIVLQQGYITLDGNQENGIPSGPGQIQDDLVVYTGASGTGLNDNNLPVLCGTAKEPINCVDNPFPAPTGSQDTTFGTDQSADPTPTFTGDRDNPVDVNTGLSGNTWDIQLGALDAFLTGSNSLIFLFQHNQDNAGTDQDVFGWGQVILSDVDGKLPDICFNFNNNTTQGATSCTQPQAFTGRDTDPENPTLGGPQGDFVFAAGQVCLDINGANVACDGSQGAVVLGPINHNLGLDEFAYAIFSFGLDNFLATCLANLVACGYDVMRVDVRLRDLTNGPEQLVIVQGRIPAPAAIGLLAVGLVGLGVARLRRRRRAS